MSTASPSATTQRRTNQARAWRRSRRCSDEFFFAGWLPPLPPRLPRFRLAGAFGCGAGMTLGTTADALCARCQVRQLYIFELSTGNLVAGRRTVARSSIPVRTRTNGATHTQVQVTHTARSPCLAGFGGVAIIAIAIPKRRYSSSSQCSFNRLPLCVRSRTARRVLPI